MYEGTENETKKLEGDDLRRFTNGLSQTHEPDWQMPLSEQSMLLVQPASEAAVNGAPTKKSAAAHKGPKMNMALKREIVQKTTLVLLSNPPRACQLSFGRLGSVWLALLAWRT